MLDEGALESLVQAGCACCGGTRLLFRSYLDGLLPLIGGDPCGALTWVYDGEKFVDGVYEVTCASCERIVFAADVCPRCHADGGLARALAGKNAWPVPTVCPSCEEDQVRYIALIPGKVLYEGKRAEKARTHVELFDVGFHGYRVDCRDCGTVGELTDHCPLCETRGPLRARP